MLLKIEINLLSKRRGFVSAYCGDSLITAEEPFHSPVMLRKALRLKSISDWIAVHHTFLGHTRNQRKRPWLFAFEVDVTLEDMPHVDLTAQSETPWLLAP